MMRLLIAFTILFFFLLQRINMNLLLDTHVLIWVFENSDKTSNTTKDVIINGRNMVFVSSASVWEMSIKKAMGKLIFPDNLLEEIKLHRFTLLDINYEHTQLAGELPQIHKDPFDRMLVAQAITEKLTLVTNDRYISEYNVKILKT